MENNGLARMFDQVKLSREREEAMLADLLKEKREVSSMKQTNSRRRIPAAALAAAVLVAALAGTALAMEHFGRVSLVPQSGTTDGSETSAYSVYGEYDLISADRLSEEVLSLGEGTGEYGDINRSFASREECEAFLGLDLADNPKLDQMQQSAVMDIDGDGEPAANAVRVSYYDRLPNTITVWSFYGGDGYQLTECAILRTEYNYRSTGEDMRLGGMQGAVEFEDYVTPDGMEARIATESRDDGTARYIAHFARGNALFTLDFWFMEDHEFNGAALEVLKEILDAYE